VINFERVINCTLSLQILTQYKIVAIIVVVIILREVYYIKSIIDEELKLLPPALKNF